MEKEKNTEELAKATSTNLLRAKSESVVELVRKTKELEKTPLTSREFREMIATVIAACGIKEFPSGAIVGLCLESFEKKYSISMNKQEVALALMLNIRGDLNKKVEHYQCFSFEYFCEVLNEYRKLKISLNKVLPSVGDVYKKIAPPEIGKSILKAIVEDFEVYCAGKELEANYPTKSKLDYLSMLFEVDDSDENISPLRERARNNIWRKLASEKHKQQALNKFGAALSLQHQISRIKSGQLITEGDEQQIQFEVCRLLYLQTFDKYKSNPNYFITHIKTQI